MERKNQTKFFFLFFRNCPKKGAKADAFYIVNTLKVLLKRMKQKRPLKKLKNLEFKKKIGQFFFKYFFQLTPKTCPWGLCLHPQRPQSVFEEDEAEEAAEGSSSKYWTGVHLFCSTQLTVKGFQVSRILDSSQPNTEYWNRTTTLIPFLEAFKHICNSIPSYFMERFAFLIDDTSYVYMLIQ